MNRQKTDHRFSNSASALLGRFRVSPKVVVLALLWLVTVAFAVDSFALAPVWSRDFMNYWLGPRAVWAGVNPYDLTAYTDFGLAQFPASKIRHFNFTYPPQALLLFAPFATLSPNLALAAWDIVSLGVFYLATRPLLPKGFPAFVAVLSPATLICLQFGQTGLLSSALFLMAARGSGLAAGILTFKPHLGFLVPPALLLSSRKSVLIAIASTLLLVAISELAFGYWADFIRHAVEYQATQLVDVQEGIWYLIGTTPMIGYGVPGLVLYGIGAAIVLSRNFNVLTAATATFLISPYGFHYDMSAVCLGFALVLYSYWGEMPLWQKAVAALAYLTPLIVGFGTWWVPPILLLGLFVQTQWFPGVRLGVKARRFAIVEV